VPERPIAEFSLFFRFWDGFLSDFSFFDAKTTGKPHDISDISFEHITHARQCVLVPERPFAEF
jgi:hypothetical protein